MAPRAFPVLSTRLYAVDDDDDDGDDENPLGKGVDSVSWLPSVVGQSAGSGTPQLKEVRLRLPLVVCPPRAADFF